MFTFVLQGVSSALYIAAQNNSWSICKLLLEHGADVNLQTKVGVTNNAVLGLKIMSTYKVGRNYTAHVAIICVTLYSNVIGTIAHNVFFFSH